MRYVFNENTLISNGVIGQEYVDSIVSMLDTIEFICENGYRCYYSPEYAEREVVPGLTLFDLQDENFTIYLDRDLVTRILITFNKIINWELDDLPPINFDVAIGTSSNFEHAPSIAWAHGQLNDNGINEVSCICALPHHKSGLNSVTCGNIQRQIWFSQSVQSSREFARWFLANGTSTVEQFSQHVAFAFNQLEFVPNVLNGIKTFSRAYRDCIVEVVHHLGVLSDHGPRIMSGDRMQASQEFGTLGVNASDESGKTKQNSTAKSARTAKFRDINRVFWWHTKILGDRERIHFCANDVEQGGKIVIGVIHYHLTT